MNKKRLPLFALFFGLFSVLLIWSFGLAVTKDAQAACGASTSSCKTCHEVQGQDPVSQKGDWHVQHSFGDFCQACHLGVATETDKTKAHAGIVAKPQANPEQSCASCHPADAAARAAKYGGSAAPSGAGTSGTSASGASQASGTSSSVTDSSAPAVSPAATQVPPSSNPNFDLIDYNAGGKLSWLARALIAADILAILALAVLIWKWKTGLWPWNLKAKRRNVPFNTLPAEAQEVFKNLLAGDMQTILAIREILEQEQGRNFLQAVATSSELVSELCRLTEAELKSLLAVVQAQKKNGKGEA